MFVGPEKAPAPEYVFMHRDRMDDTSHDTIRAVRDERFRYVRNYRPQLPYLQPIAYRDRAATMNEVYRVLNSDDVPATMWQWAAKTKPVEELYDTEADPDEVYNLADDPQHRATIERLRTALEEWVERIDDPLATDELEVLRTRVWPPDGKQRTTAQLELRHNQALSGRRIVAMLAGQGIGLGLNLGVAVSSTLLPAEAVAWLAAVAAEEPMEAAGRLCAFAPPGELPGDLLEALGIKLAAMAAVIGAAHLATARHEDGTEGALLALIGVPEAARAEVARAVAEAVRFSDTAGPALDVVFPADGGATARAVARVGARLDLPRPAERPVPARGGPRMDPVRPPILRR